MLTGVKHKYRAEAQLTAGRQKQAGSKQGHSTRRTHDDNDDDDDDDDDVYYDEDDDFNVISNQVWRQ